MSSYTFEVTQHRFIKMDLKRMNARHLLYLIMTDTYRKAHVTCLNQVVRLIDVIQKHEYLNTLIRLMVVLHHPGQYKRDCYTWLCPAGVFLHLWYVFPIQVS